MEEQSESGGGSLKKAQSEPASKRQLDFGGARVGPPPATQLKPVVVMQPKPPPMLVQMQVQAPVSSIRPPKPESPRARPRQTAEVKDGTPKKQKQCNCKHSRCLKLYCECFASGIYCDGCNCVNCNNNVENEAARREAVEATLERNPNAFRPKIASSPHGARENRDEAGEVLVLGKHNKGCHCKKSGCLKKYCECFQANILCSDNCKCMDCKNFEGSEERQALFHGDPTTNLSYLQQAANAAITGAVGSSGFGSPPVTKKRKSHELFFGSTGKDPSIHRLAQFQQTNNIKDPASSASLSSIPGSRGYTTAMVPSKFTYRSLLADIIQPQDLKELCSVLVVYSGEAAKMLADESDAREKRVEDYRESSITSSTQDRLQNQKECDAERSVTDDCSSANHTEKTNLVESGSDGADGSKGRPLSPGTLALMCDEQDTMFTSAASQNGLMSRGNNTSSQLPHEQGMSKIYAEQERIVLTKFRDCLNKLIAFGQIKERNCSSMAQTESSGGETDVLRNNTTNVGSETSNPLPFGNGVPNTPILSTSKMPHIVNSAATVAAASSNDPHPTTPVNAANGNTKPNTEKTV